MILDLQQNRDFEQLLDRSKTDPVLIFKHSTQCAISAEAYQEFTSVADAAEGLVCATVLVVEHRQVSDAIAKRLGIRHQSPQALLIQNGQVVWHASHWSITTDAL